MERLVREELERWDSEASFSQQSGSGGRPQSGRASAQRSRPGSQASQRGGPTTLGVCAEWIVFEKFVGVSDISVWFEYEECWVAMLKIYYLVRLRSKLMSNNFLQNHVSIPPQSCQVVRISRILYENSFKIREYYFYLKNTDFERLKK